MNLFIKFFWIFMLSGFLGYVVETIWCLLKWHKLESRKGLIYEHLILIYGLAGLFIVLVVEALHITKAVQVFLVTFLISGVVEYVSSWFQEICFGTTSWDYSKKKFNLNGRITVGYLFMFGLVGVFWCKCYPSLLKVIFGLFSQNLLVIITVFLAIFLVYDCFISYVASRRQRNRREGISARNKFDEYLDRKYTDEFLAKIFPNSKVRD